MSEKTTKSIREYRKRSGLTQEELARRMGVSRQTIISIERGRYTPSLTLAIKIARFFNVATDDLFGLEEGE